MPKEVVGGMGYDVEVSWGRDQDHVQVATVFPSGSSGTLKKLVEQTSDSENEHMRGLYATFTDRQSLNMMIRILRRARDGAFGADA